VDYGDAVGNWDNHYGNVEFVGSRLVIGAAKAADAFAARIAALNLPDQASLNILVHGIVGLDLLAFHPLPHYGGDLHLV
jgi:hypothetical protein